MCSDFSGAGCLGGRQAQRAFLRELTRRRSPPSPRARAGSLGWPRCCGCAPCSPPALPLPLLFPPPPPLRAWGCGGRSRRRCVAPAAPLPPPPPPQPRRRPRPRGWPRASRQRGRQRGSPPHPRAWPQRSWRGQRRRWCRAAARRGISRQSRRRRCASASSSSRAPVPPPPPSPPSPGRHLLPLPSEACRWLPHPRCCRRSEFYVREQEWEAVAQGLRQQPQDLHQEPRAQESNPRGRLHDRSSRQDHQEVSRQVHEGLASGLTGRAEL